jgi:signal transduction histidine kinase
VNVRALDDQAMRSGAPQPFRGPFARWPRAADAVLAIAMFLVIVFVSEGPNEEFAIRSIGEVSIAAFIYIAVASAIIYWRRSYPQVALPVTIVATALSLGFGYPDLVGITMMVALYSVGRYATNDRWSYIGLGGAFAVVASSALLDEVTAAEIGFGFFVMLLVWYIGRWIRIRGELGAQREREQAAEARQAVAEERTRIARELHDVVAHQVSLMTVQAGAAKTVAADDPEGAAKAMEAVEKAGHQALGELRHLLGVLRPATEVDGLGPQPGVVDLPRLVGQLKDAGLDVSLTMEEGQTDLPARVNLSAYRIVQEALTNVLKHAGPNARAEVVLKTDNHGLTISVLDDGHGATILPASGHGTLGMRERALLLGGSLDAGPRPGGGWQVVAYLPIAQEPA